VVAAGTVSFGAPPLDALAVGAVGAVGRGVFAGGVVFSGGAAAGADFTDMEVSGGEETAVVDPDAAVGFEFCGPGPTIPEMMTSTTKPTGGQNHHRFQRGFLERREADGRVAGVGSSGDNLNLPVIG
jgi:hypothetical protein